MVVSRRYDMVLEEMQAKWAKERMEGLSQTPREYPKKCPNSRSGDQVGESVQDSLSRLRVQVQHLCSAVTDLKARYDLQIEVHAARPFTTSTPVSRRRVEEYDEMLTLLFLC